MCWGLGPVHGHSLVFGSVSESPQKSRLVNSVSVSTETLSFSSLVMLLPTFADLLELHLMFGCGSLHLFPLTAGWSLSEDSYARILSTRITEYHS